MLAAVLRPVGILSASGLLPALLLGCVLSGCGDNPYKTVRISGTITYEDGSLIQAEALEQIDLEFWPLAEAIDAQTHPRPGKAIVKVSDGTFDCATTYSEFGDGVIPGKHKVVVQPMIGGMPARGLVPANYMDSKATPLEVTIEPGMAPLELKIPKPR